MRTPQLTHRRILASGNDTNHCLDVLMEQQQGMMRKQHAPQAKCRQTISTQTKIRCHHFCIKGGMRKKNMIAFCFRQISETMYGALVSQSNRHLSTVVFQHHQRSQRPQEVWEQLLSCITYPPDHYQMQGALNIP